jgi:hypothetical protein
MMNGGLRISKPLNDRKNSHQLSKRREKMAHRTETQRTLAQHVGVINQVIGNVVMLRQAVKRLSWGLLVTAVVGVVDGVYHLVVLYAR